MKPYFEKWVITQKDTTLREFEQHSLRIYCPLNVGINSDVHNLGWEISHC